MALEPITRQEKIIAGQDLTPITRMEMFLKQFGGGGGGGGGSADAVLYTAQTLTDAQKKQARENVDAAIADYIVNGTVNSDNTVTLDKTFAQIMEAIDAGKTPAVKIGFADSAINIYIPLTLKGDDQLEFSYADNSQVAFTSIYVSPNKDPKIDITKIVSLNHDGTAPQYIMEADPTEAMQIATKKYVDDKECILKSTTPGSTKKFKITVDDSGNISATEVM